MMRSRHSRSCDVRSKKTSAEPLDELMAVLKSEPPTRNRPQKHNSL